ncbi:glycoside hydrolase family 43 protein [Paenibacillus sp. HWE-109]|uniref:glycoside hydrolase family 43 protein n=1 Tax=Paenibacillus sp. HWE-109 TaxID=1306526 RepID=UPI001EDD7936|nr:glycoside hydrolase family 43 protein [Paenibacillus sp. HWE-109]UKS27009.1 glycoside hydrolase family 43 protein [Paenibacillus sp. HWE-109]
MYLFSYFKEDDEKLFIASSHDGLQWNESNGGMPLFESDVGTKQMRDPFLLEDEEGGFHLVWTDGWRSLSIGYARSSDLVNWHDAKLIPVMEHLPLTQNTWAPEIFYDTMLRAYRIIWSSTVGMGPRNHRIWSVTTSNFESFSEASLFFDPGYNVIDASVTDMGEYYYMLYKDERGQNEKGTAFKAIRSCRVAKEDSNRPSVTEVSELLTPELTEGPTMYALEEDGSTQWIMLVDGFQEQCYSAYQSVDLDKWEDVTHKIQLPSGARHGAVMKLKTARKLELLFK